jgi:UDP:flavonoid glycosyltransferase YjiC (YdhE family)
MTVKRIAVFALGTRGDVQPMLALAKGLKAAGYDITLVTGENFVGWAQQQGLDAIGTVDVDAMMSSENGVAWSESSRRPAQQLVHMGRLMNEYGPQMTEGALRGIDGADAMISGFVSDFIASALAEKYQLPVVSAALQPYRPSRSGPASLSPIFPRGTSVLNTFMGHFVERMLFDVYAPTMNNFRTQTLGLPALDLNSYYKRLHAMPTVNGFSRFVVPPARDWEENVYTAGYWFLEESGWTPPKELVQFLEAGTPPVYVGFGSMTGSDPAGTVKLIADVLNRLGLRGVIPAHWGTTTFSQVDLPAHLYALDKIPHRWLFPRMEAVVHHGGAGTTAAGLYAGKPTLVVPHMSDQPFWGRRVAALEAGPHPLPRHRLNSRLLTARLRELVTNTMIHSSAQVLGEKIRAEHGIDNAVRFIKEQFGAPPKSAAPRPADDSSRSQSSAQPTEPAGV